MWIALEGRILKIAKTKCPRESGIFYIACIFDRILTHWLFPFQDDFQKKIICSLCRYCYLPTQKTNIEFGYL